MMRNNKDKGDERGDSKKTNIEEMGRKAEIKREEEELRAWRRRIRIERRKEDEEWRKYREDRIKQKKRWKELSKDEKKRFRLEKKNGKQFVAEAFQHAWVKGLCT